MKNWQQEREEEEKAEQIYGDDDADQDGDAASLDATSQKVGEMSVNGDEGSEEGRRKE